MCYRISWGAIVTGGPTWTPTPPPCPTGWVFGGGNAGLQLFPSLVPPGFVYSQQWARGSLNETIPFAVSGPPGAVTVTLKGTVVGAFSRSRTPGNFWLLPTHFWAQGKVEIRDGAGEELYRISESALRDGITMYMMMSSGVSKSGTSSCVLQVGPAYQLYVELDVFVKLRTWRYWTVAAGQGANAAADFILPAGIAPGTAGVTGAILLPPCPSAPSLPGGGGVVVSTPPVVFPPQPPSTPPGG